MKNKKGYTLVEVIISLAILGIISASFLGATSNYLGYMNHTKEITKDAFLIQREMEEEIDDVKEKISNNELALEKKTIFSSLGGIDVEYYEVKKTDNKKDFYTLVSNVKPDPLELVELEYLDFELRQDTDKVSYGYGSSGFSVLGFFNNLELYKYDHLLNQVEWYISNKEFNMPMPKHPDFNLNDDILYNSYYFPLFPRDYVIVDNDTIYKFGYSETSLDNLSDYAGRHIIFSVTPAAKSGKLGIPMVSDPIFISGLPITDNLIMHFDAGYIDRTMADEVEENSGQYLVNKWIDLSSILGRSNIDENQSAIPSYDSKPFVNRTEMGRGFIGQYLQFYNGQYLRARNNNINGKDIHVISVVKNRSESEETSYIINGSTRLMLEANDVDNSGWTVVFNSFRSDSDDFYIEGDYLDIAEIIVYDGIQNEENLNQIEDYLVEKYGEPIITGDIISLYDISFEIQVGDEFTLPSMVLADMGRGSEKYVSVTWSGEFDTEVPGTYTITGSAVTNPVKKMIYTLTVNE